MTNLDTEDPNWRLYHDPSHEELKSNMSEFIKKMIAVTKVMPRVEKVFRDERDSRIAIIRKEQEDSEKSGGGAAGNAGRFGRGGGARNPNDVNFQNMTQEEKDEDWRKRWQLPKPFEQKMDNERYIQGHKSVKPTIDLILDSIENIKQVMDDDKKHWRGSDEFIQLNGRRSDRGKKRILNGTNDPLDVDPVAKYKQSIEFISELLSDCKNRPSQKPEQFIIIDCSKLKQVFMDQGSIIIQSLFEHLIKDSKEDLRSLLQEFTETIDELKTPSSDLSHLKKNKDKYNEVRNKLNLLNARREPIKKKFKYIFD